MTKDKNNNTEKTSRKRPPKIRHIDVRFTEEEYNLVVHNARLSGRSKSTYLHDLGIGHKPSSHDRRTGGSLEGLNRGKV